MRWRDTVKLFQMAGSDRGGQQGLAKGTRIGRQENEVQQREGILSQDGNQF